MNLAKGAVVFCCLFYNVSGLEPLALMAIGTAVFAGIYTTLNSYERCDPRWINLNTDGWYFGKEKVSSGLSILLYK